MNKTGIAVGIAIAFYGFVDPISQASASEGSVTPTQASTAITASAVPRSADTGSRVGETTSVTVSRGAARPLFASAPELNDWFEESTYPPDPPVDALSINSGVCVLNGVFGQFTSAYPTDTVDIVWSSPYWVVQGTPPNGPPAQGIGIYSYCALYNQFANPNGTPYTGSVTWVTTPFDIWAQNGGYIQIPMTTSNFSFNNAFCYIRGIHGDWAKGGVAEVEQVGPNQWDLSLQSPASGDPKIEVTGGCIQFNGVTSTLPVSKRFISVGNTVNTGIPSSGTGGELCALESIAGPMTSVDSGVQVFDYLTGIWELQTGAGQSAIAQCLPYKL